MSPKPDVSEERTAQIIEAATALFAGKGFDRATMEDIADQAGINKATIYLYFDSKDALIRAIAEALFAQELADLQAAHDRPGTATERLTAYYEALIADEAEMLPLMPILYEFYALGLRREDVRAVVADFIGRSSALLEAIIQEGIESGEFRPTDARQAARALDALLSGTILHWVYAPEEVDVDAQLRYSVRLALQGLLNHS
ncbi:MAG: TetR/AcrR family transcriptional regulator [Anaerolineae bacterium]|nr:TetR/AcrR family transcriptional regulator [Anaerolineae bacterium]